MNNVTPITKKNPTSEITAALAEAQPLVLPHWFYFIAPDAKKAKALQSAFKIQHPDLRHVETRQLVDSCADQELVFTAELPVSSAVFSNLAETFRELAEKHDSDYWSFHIGSLDSNESKRPRGKELMMRCEFLGDAIELRLALGQYVLNWTELSTNLCEEGDHPVKLNGFDRELKFEVIEDCPSIDHLRWYINQIDDMHVAAETLQYAERYTGIRMPDWLLDTIEPPLEVVESMLKGAKAIVKWRGTRKSRLNALVQRLTEHVKRLGRDA